MVISRDEAFSKLAKHFETDEYTAEQAYYSAANFLQLAHWEVLEEAEYQEVVYTIHNITGLGVSD